MYLDTIKKYMNKNDLIISIAIYTDAIVFAPLFAIFFNHT